MEKVKLIEEEVYSDLIDFIEKTSRDTVRVLAEVSGINEQKILEFVEKDELEELIREIERRGKDIFEVLGKTFERLEEIEKRGIFYIWNVDDDRITVQKYKINPEVITELSDEILVANWFDKEDVEELLGEEISDEKYEEIVARWNDEGNWDEVSEVVSDWLFSIFNEIKNNNNPNKNDDDDNDDNDADFKDFEEENIEGKSNEGIETQSDVKIVKIHEYKCEQCGRHWFIPDGEKQEYDIDFGCPFGCDNAGKKIGDIKAVLVYEKMICEYTGRKIEKIINFKACGTFGAINKAEEYLRQQGYKIGSMCGDEPIGFAKGISYIAKWRNIPPSDYHKLDGIIVSDDFREGDVKVIFYAKEG